MSENTNANTMERKNKILTGALIGVGLGALGLGLYCGRQTRICRELIGSANRRIADMSNVDIDQNIINRAVEKAVREQSGSAVNAAVARIEEQTKADIRNRVKQAVGNATEKINARVATQIAKQTEELCVDDIKEDVVKHTTEMLVEKLSDDLDNEIGKIGKVYLSIANAIK